MSEHLERQRSAYRSSIERLISKLEPTANKESKSDSSSQGNGDRIPMTADDEGSGIVGMEREEERGQQHEQQMNNGNVVKSASGECDRKYRTREDLVVGRTERPNGVGGTSPAGGSLATPPVPKILIHEKLAEAAVKDQAKKKDSNKCIRRDFRFQNGVPTTSSSSGNGCSSGPGDLRPHLLRYVQQVRRVEELLAASERDREGLVEEYSKSAEDGEGGGKGNKNE